MASHWRASVHFSSMYQEVAQSIFIYVPCSDQFDGKQGGCSFRRAEVAGMKRERWVAEATMKGMVTAGVVPFAITACFKNWYDPYSQSLRAFWKFYWME